MEKFATWLKDNRYSYAAFGRALAESMQKAKPISYQTVASWAEGRRKPGPKTAKAISDFTSKAVPESLWRPHFTL